MGSGKPLMVLLGCAAAVSNRRWSIERYDAKGTLRAIIRVATSSQEITDSIKAEQIRLTVSQMRERVAASPPPQGMDLDEQEQNLRNIPWAPVIPPIDSPPSAWTGSRSATKPTTAS